MQMRDTLDKEEQAKLFIVIDSWNSLTSSKTNEDALVGKDTADMTTAKKKNTLAKLLQGFGTCFVVNQLYANIMDQYNPYSIGGGGGLFYAASSIVMGTSKSKDKDTDGEISGTFVLAQTKKSRFAVENSKLKYLIKYEGGIHPVYGILEDAIEGGFIIKPSNGWYSRPCVTDDKKWREKEVWDNWKEFWGPILSDKKFKEYIETVYSFKHSSIVDGDINIPDSDDL